MYEVILSRDNFTFAAAHFLTDVGSGTRERLHGHNYVPEIRVATSTVDDDALVVNFAAVKDVVCAVTSRLNHKVLVPLANPMLDVHLGRRTVGMRFGIDAFVLPRDDVVPIDAVNVSCESLAQLLGQKIVDGLAAVSPADGSVTVTLAESERQAASFTMPLRAAPPAPTTSTQSRAASPKELLHLDRVLTLAENAARQGHRPFAAAVACGDTLLTTGTAGSSPLDHASIIALRSLGPDQIHAGPLTLYASREPCPMCLFTAHAANVHRIVYGAPIETTAHTGSRLAPIESATLATATGLGLEIVGSLLADRAERLLLKHHP